MDADGVGDGVVVYNQTRWSDYEGTKLILGE